MSRLLFGLKAVVIALTGAVALQQRPDFSGDWVLDRAQSRFGYAALDRLDSGLVRIEHTQQAFMFCRRFVVDAQADTLSWALVPDGPEDTSSEGSRRSFSRLRWAGNTLIFTSRIVAPQGQAADTVWYRLLKGGRVLEAQERFRGPRLRYDNRWVFDRR